MTKEIVEVDTSSGEFVELHKGDELSYFTLDDDFKCTGSVCFDDIGVGEFSDAFAEEVESGRIRDLSIVVAQDYLQMGDPLVVELKYEGEAFWEGIKAKDAAREDAGVVVSEDGKTLRQVPRGIKNITIPEGVQTIGSCAFAGCDKLRTVTIPSTVTKIDERAFQGCVALEDLVLSEGLAKIGRCAFVGCRSIRTIHIPESVEVIDGMAFKWCSALSEITMPQCVKSVGFDAFVGCESLNGRPILSGNGKALVNWPGATGDIRIPDGVEEISAFAFHECSDLEVVRMPSSVRNVNGAAFFGCRRLRKIIAPAGLDVHAMTGKRALKVERYVGQHSGDGFVADVSKEMRNGVVSIDVTNEEWLERNEMGLLGIKSGCFANCDNVEKVIVGEGIGFIGEKAFVHCSNLVEVELPESMLAIEDCAFYHCSKLSRIVLPNDAVRIGRYAFVFCCKSLMNLCFRGFVGKVVREYFCQLVHSERIYFLSEDARTIYGAYVQDGELAVPEGVEIVANEACENDCSLKKLVLPDSVRSIGGAAFSGCSHLSEIQFGNGISTIGRHCFKGCAALERVVILSESVTISALAFADCLMLTEVVLPEKTAYCDGSVFGGCLKLSGKPICVGRGRILLEWPNAEGEIDIPNDITTIGQWSFCWCKKLTSVNIPVGVERIADGAFCDCSSLSSIKIPSSVLQICPHAFAGCGALKSVEIPNPDIEIVETAFPADVKVEKAEWMVGTMESLKRFMAERKKETYKQLVLDFVFEVMAAERHACFPADVNQLSTALSEEGKPVGTGIVRDDKGLPYLVFLTSRKMLTGPFSVSVEMVASEVFVRAMPDPGLAGVAINPWNDGGVLIPKPALMAAMNEIGEMMGNKSE